MFKEKPWGRFYTPDKMMLSSRETKENVVKS
jgi:hypothetical protein